MRFCTACGTPVSGTRRYCTHCGARIRRIPDPELEAARVGAAQAAVPAPSPGLPVTESQGPEPASPEPPSPEPASPEPASPDRSGIPLSTTWLADFAREPEPPATVQDPLPPTAPVTGRTLLAVAVVAVLIALGSVAWMAGSSRPRPDSQPSVASRLSRGKTARPGTRHPAARPSAPRPSAPWPSGSAAVTPLPSSRRGIVSASRALAGRADAQQVVGFLDSYFAAVNHREYQEYSSLFERGHHLTPAEFTRGYATTHDTSALLAGLASTRDGLTATVTFTSHQARTASPNHTLCTHWWVVLYLRQVRGVYLIGPPPPGYHARYRGCN